MASDKVRLKVLRQDALDKPDTRRWEEFEVPSRAGMTVHECLEEIRKRPVTAQGKEVPPVAWEASCLEEVCGSCTMLVQGRARHACSAFVDEVAPRGQTITLAPLSRFPLERDLIVERSKMFEALKRVKAWVRLDASTSAIAPPESQDTQAERYSLSRCISCGACLEACPEFHEASAFVGAAAINQARLMNLHGVGALDRRARTESLMGEGGVADCGKAQNCVEVCPKDIPLVDSIAELARDTTKQLLFGWLFEMNARSWALLALVLAGCTVKSPTGARSVQTVTATLVTLEFLPREDVPERKGMSLIGSPGDDGYGYEFSDDPLAAGMCRAGPCQPTDNCPPWSQCEVSKTLEIHKREFGKCLGKELTRDGTKIVTFTTRAHVRADGVVDGADIGDLEPSRSELRGCVERAFREVAFPLEADGLITELTVPVRLAVVGKPSG